jgi:hypothetical protein
MKTFIVLKFNLLTIMTDLGTKPNRMGHKERWVRCKCDCGKLKVLRLQSIKTDGTKSCGCLNESILTLKQKRQGHVRATAKYRKAHPEQYKEYSRKSHFTIGARYSLLKYHSKLRHFDMLLTKEEFGCILKNPCYYCNKSLENESGYGYGLDRIDNSKGYAVDNVLPCCGSCNRTRGDRLTVEEMKFVMIKLISYRNGVRD